MRPVQRPDAVSLAERSPQDQRSLLRACSGHQSQQGHDIGQGVEKFHRQPDRATLGKKRKAVEQRKIVSMSESSAPEKCEFIAPMCKESSANFLFAKSELHSFSTEEIQTAVACPLVNI
jgi:hypothetical protein